MDVSGEAVALKVKPSHWHYSTWYALSFFFLMGSLWGYIRIPTLSLIFLFTAGLGGALLGGTLLARHCHTFIVTSHHIVRQFSFISHHSASVRHTQIAGVHIKQGLIGRLFNVGSLHISTSMAGSVDMTFFGISHPHRVREAIQHHAVSSTKTPLHILEERLARGEITENEFVDMKKHLTH